MAKKRNVLRVQGMYDRNPTGGYEAIGALVPDDADHHEAIPERIVLRCGHRHREHSRSLSDCISRVEFEVWKMACDGEL